MTAELFLPVESEENLSEITKSLTEYEETYVFCWIHIFKAIRSIAEEFKYENVSIPTIDNENIFDLDCILEWINSVDVINFFANRNQGVPLAEQVAGIAKLVRRRELKMGPERTKEIQETMYKIIFSESNQ